MSITNESSRIRSWFQFNNKSNNISNNSSMSRSDDEKSVQIESQCDSQTHNNNTNNTLLERVTSFRRSLGKSHNRKHKIRPSAASIKGLTSAVEQQNIAKSKNISTRKPSSPTATSIGSESASSVNCDDDEIYGFTSANFDSHNSNTRRQLKSSLHNTAPNITVYESEANKSGRVRNEENESHPNVNVVHNNTNITNSGKGVSQDSPEWLKADGEFSFYQQNQQNFDSRDSIGSRLYYYKHQYFQDSDKNIGHTSAQHLSWTEPLNSEPDDIDRIYENMRGFSSSMANSQQRQQSHRNNPSANNCNNSYVNNSINNTNETVSNNRKLTKDSGYESASTSISNWAAMNPNANALSNNYFHSRSDSNTSSVSTGGSLSPRTAGSTAKSAYHYCDPWTTAKSTSNLALQLSNNGIRRSSLSSASNAHTEGVVNTGQSVLPAKSVPGNLDRDSDENLLRKRSHNRNNPTPSSVYSLLASKSGFDFTPVLKLSRKSCGSSFSENPIVSKYNDRILSKGSNINCSQLWKTHEKNLIQTCGHEEQYSLTDDSPPPTPPVRDSSLSSNRKFNLVSQQSDAQNKSISESINKTNESTKHDRNLGQTVGSLYYKNSSQYYMKSYSSDNRVSHNIGYSKSLINLRSKYEESSDLKQFSQTYPLLPETDFNDKQMQESWSCDQSVTSGVTSLVTSSDYFTASSSVMTHSPSLSSLNTNATNTTNASYNNSRNSLSSTSSSSQIARSAKVLQPKRQESQSVLYYEKSRSPLDSAQREAEIPPPPPPPKLHFNDYNEMEATAKGSSIYANKTISIPRSVDPLKTHKMSDSEIKAIQKRALYQFFLKQKEKQKNSSTSNATPPEAIEDTNQIPSRKVQLVVQENIYENSDSACIASPPSPPLPPPPPSVSDVEFIGDLPLPPPPSPPLTQCERESATILTHSISQSVSIAEPSFSMTVQQSGHPSSPALELVSVTRAPDVASHKSEIATQTTETLSRNCGNTSAKKTTQLHKPSLETNESMYHQNEVITTSKRNTTNKSMESVESVVPWAYSKLWPNEKCVETTYYDNDSSHISQKSSSPITAANTFISSTGVSLSCSSNEDLLANKSELISRLSRKLDVLRSEEMALSQDIEANETLGQQVKNKLKSLGITPQESEKINLHCDETEKVTRLLLSISARLQHIELQINETTNRKLKINENEFNANSMRSDLIQQSSKQTISQNDSQKIRDWQSSYDSNHLFGEIQLLGIKRDKLLTQLEEALQLRVSIDNRSHIIEEKILTKYFKDNNEDLNEFIEFIKLKSKLIVDIREIRDKIQLGEKHVCALKNSY